MIPQTRSVSWDIGIVRGSAQGAGANRAINPGIIVAIFSGSRQSRGGKWRSLSIIGALRLLYHIPRHLSPKNPTPQNSNSGATPGNAWFETAKGKRAPPYWRRDGPLGRPAGKASAFRSFPANSHCLPAVRPVAAPYETQVHDTPRFSGPCSRHAYAPGGTTGRCRGILCGCTTVAIKNSPEHLSSSEDFYHIKEQFLSHCQPLVSARNQTEAQRSGFGLDRRSKGAARMAFFYSAGKKERRSKADFAPICTATAVFKPLPATGFRRKPNRSPAQRVRFG